MSSVLEFLNVDSLVFSFSGILGIFTTNGEAQLSYFDLGTYLHRFDLRFPDNGKVIRINEQKNALIFHQEFY